jgi:nucleotide-binding universal stress UspA family protein
MLMHEIVVGLDGSDESGLALRWAVAVAQLANLPVRAVEAWTYPKLSVVPGRPPLLPAAEMDQRTAEDIRDVVTKVLGKIPSTVSVEALRGPAAAAILQTLTPDSVLVLGTRGRGGFSGLLLGSVSRECLEYAPCPVVIVRHDRPPVDSDGVILVGKDGSDGAARALDWAVTFGQMTGARVAAVYAWEAGVSEVNPRLHQRLRAEAKSSVEGWTAGSGTELGSIEVEGEARAKLVELAERLDAKLIVVGRRGTSRLRGLRTGGITSYLVSNSPTTVAVVPPVTGATG